MYNLKLLLNKCMDTFEVKKINTYLNNKFNSDCFSVKIDDNSKDSAEVFYKDEFIGLLYKDDEDGEIAFQFHMTILDEDLLDA